MYFSGTLVMLVLFLFCYVFVILLTVFVRRSIRVKVGQALSGEADWVLQGSQTYRVDVILWKIRYP